MPYEFLDPNETKVTLRVESSRTFKVVHGFRYLDQYNDNRAYTVPDETPTDLASVPLFLQWLVLSYGKHTNAAIVHDVYWNRAGADRREANTAFRHAMWESDVPYLRRWLMWTAVTLAMIVKGRGGPLRLAVWLGALVTVVAGLLATNSIVLSTEVPKWMLMVAVVPTIITALVWARASGGIATLGKNVTVGLIGLLAVFASLSQVGNIQWVADHGALVAVSAEALAFVVWGKYPVAPVIATVGIQIVLVPLAGIAIGLLLYGILEVSMHGFLWVGRWVKSQFGQPVIGTLNPASRGSLNAPLPPDASLNATQV